MSQSGVILRRFANQYPPNAYIELAVKANPHGWGAALVNNDKALEVAKGNEGMTLEFFQETCKTYPDKDITFYFCNSSAGLAEEDIGPYTVMSKDGNDKIVAFITGDWPGLVQEKSAHPAQFFVANKFLFPKLSAFAELADDDVGKIMKLLGKPHMKGDMLRDATAHGIITLVADNGTSLTFADTNKSMEYPWGWVSDNYGYALGAPKKEEPKVPEKKSMFKSPVREAAPKQPDKAIAEAVKATTTGTAAPHQFKVVKWKPDRMSRSQRKDQIKNRVGYLPRGWNDDNFEVEVYADLNGKILTMSQVKALGLAVAGLPKLNNPSPVSSREDKDTETEHVVTKPAASPAVTTEVLPLISPTSREFLKNFLALPETKKLIGDNADVLPHDPKKVQQLEEKIAPFNIQAGIKDIKETYNWSYEMIAELNKHRPDIVQVMCWTFKNMLASNGSKVATKAEEGTVSPSQVDPPVAAQPKKKSMFSKAA